MPLIWDFCAPCFKVVGPGPFEARRAGKSPDNPLWMVTDSAGINRLSGPAGAVLTSEYIAHRVVELTNAAAAPHLQLVSERSA
jgi:hypothetical protein